MTNTDEPIAEYAFLSDRHGAALVSRRGSVDWWCVCRFDAASVLGRVLGREAGHWTLGPAAPDDRVRVTRRYLERSLVLETRHELEDGGVLVITDALVIPVDGDPHALGDEVPFVLARHARCEAGRVRLTSELALRPEYGLARPLVSKIDGGLRTFGGADAFVCSGGDAWSIDGSVARLEVELAAGEELGFALERHAPTADPPLPRSTEYVRVALDGTAAAWRAWDDEHANYDGPYGDLVSVSARVLHGLSYAPTGATIAAATTSLPEAPGAGRTWDYRYAWLRDAGLTMRALSVATCVDEAAWFLDWALHAAFDAGDGVIQPVYSVTGERAIHEIELDHLPGWRSTGPVRVGNDAWRQHQHDVYGQLLDSAWNVRDQAAPYEGACARFLVSLVDEVCERWTQPDDGMWELRSERRHYVSSKAMCWVAIDRAIRLADAELLEGAGASLEHWRASADEILTDIERNGWSDTAQAYAISYGSDDLDAAALLIPLFEVPLDERRIRATVEAIERGLDRDGLTDRYRIDDELPGREGAFLLCTFWLADAWARLDDAPRARRIFERAAACANDLGLMSEEFDPATGEQIGNFPQAFSHVGLVNAAHEIQRAEQRASTGAPEQ